MKGMATNFKKNTIFTKGFKKIIMVVVILMAVLGMISGKQLADNFEEKENIENIEREKWNSSESLVDDRLPENYPIYYIVSPMIIENMQGSNIMALYNDGTFMSELYTYDSYDDFQEELTTENPYWEQIKEGYAEFKNVDGTQMVVNDINPSDIRESYILQYDITDFSLSTKVDMTASEQKVFYIFGVTYDDSLVPSTHLYYSQTKGMVTISSLDKTKKTVEKILELLSGGMSKNA